MGSSWRQFSVKDDAESSLRFNKKHCPGMLSNTRKNRILSRLNCNLSQSTNWNLLTLRRTMGTNLMGKGMRVSANFEKVIYSMKTKLSFHCKKLSRNSRLYRF